VKRDKPHDANHELQPQVHLKVLILHAKRKEFGPSYTTKTWLRALQNTRGTWCAPRFSLSQPHRTTSGGTRPDRRRPHSEGRQWN
jgi:hypothetical protein